MKIKNKEKIVTAFNSYIKSSFWAMCNDEQIVFHGDPHSGNVCIDENGNICFLDMGLLCALSKEDSESCRELFMSAYAGNYEKLYEMLVGYGQMSEGTKKKFKEDCKKYSEQVKFKNITFYFIDLMNACLKYEFVPPDYLFNMAKAFVCLNGISVFTDNHHTAKEILQEQMVEFLIKRSLNDCKDLIIDGISSTPKYIENTIQNGFVNTIAKASSDVKINTDLRKTLENFKEILELMQATYFSDGHTSDETEYKRTQHFL